MTEKVKAAHGHTCKMKQREERQREYERKTQYSFDDLLDDTEFSESEGIDGDFIDDM